MIKLDKRNYRKHGDKNKDLIRKSLEECGAGRSILIDNEDEIIAGNGVYEQAKAAGIPVKVVETDGSELIAVKRTDLQTDDSKRKQLAVMDNSTSDSSEFDFELLQADFEVPELQDLGIDEAALNIASVIGELQDGAFTDKFHTESDVFVVTFTFPKEKKDAFMEKMKAFGKDNVAKEIMSFLGVDEDA